MTLGEDSGRGSSPEAAHAILAEYLDRGSDAIDTAHISTNGHAETIIGDYFADRPATRDRVVLGTKLYATLHPADPNAGGAPCQQQRGEVGGSRSTRAVSAEQVLRDAFDVDVFAPFLLTGVGPQTDDCLTGGVTAAAAHRLRRPAVAALLGPACSTRGNATRPLSTNSGLAGGINGCYMGVNRDHADLSQPQR
jgi:hypothetical protein